jgi:hypothetical protein
MDAPYRRARYIPQVPDEEMISPIPAHSSCFRHSVDGDPGGFNSSQSVQDEHVHTKESSVGSYQTSPLENGSGNSTCSSDLLSNINWSETGFNIGFGGHDGDINSFLNFSGSTDFALPSTSHTMLPNDPSRDWDAAFNTRPLLPDLDTHVTLNQASATRSAGSTGSAGWSDANPWDSGLLMPGHGPFPLEHRGCDFPSCFS